MRAIFLGTPAFAVPTLEAPGRRPRGCSRSTRSRTGPRDAAPPLAQSPVKQAALRLGIAVRQPERVRRPEIVDELAADRRRRDGGGRLRADHSADDHRPAAARHHQRARLAAAEVPRRGADPMGDRERRDRHRRDDHEDRRRPRHRRHAAEGARPPSGPTRTPCRWARGWRRSARICCSRRSMACAGRRAYTGEQDDAQATYAPILKKEDGRDRLDAPGGRDIQSRARIFALARGLHSLSRAPVAHLEGKT